MAHAAASSNALQAMVNSPNSPNPHPVEKSELIEDMTEALKALQSSDEAHRAIIELINFTARPMVIQAMFSTDPAETAGYVSELKTIIDQITVIAEDSHNAYLDYSTSR